MEDDLNKLRARFAKKEIPQRENKPDKPEPSSPEPRDPGEHLAEIMRDDSKYGSKIHQVAITADMVADYLMDRDDYITIRESKEGEMLWYNPNSGIYEPYADKRIGQLTEAYLTRLGTASTATTHFVNQVIGHIGRQSYMSRYDLNTNMHIMIVKNGTLNLNTGQLLPFDKVHKATIAIPVIYDANATCPAIDKFISQVVAPADTDILYEIFAWCLMRDSEIQRFVLELGNGQDGKTKHIGLLKSFLGEQNCSYYTLQQLVSNTFAASGLEGKLANLVADLPSKALYDVGVIKMLTGGDSLQVEQKYGHSFKMFNRAKIICVANQPPDVPEDTRAFWRRLVIVEFPNLFEGANRDPYVLDKITTQGELSGLLNKAIRLIPKLKEKADLTYTRTIEDTRETYNLRSDPARVFLDECCEGTSWLAVTKKEAVYQAFLAFCAKNGMTPVGKKKLGRIIKAEKFHEERDCWSGLILKEDAKEATETENSESDDD